MQKIPTISSSEENLAHTEQDLSQHLIMDKVKTVYIIDDDEVIVYLTENIMKEKQFCERCETFNNGQLALDRIKQAIANDEELPDLMLIDIHMPVLDGWEFLDELVKLPMKKAIPLFIFTSSLDPADKEKSFSYPSIVCHIQKPLTVTKLNKILRLIP